MEQSVSPEPPDYGGRAGAAPAVFALVFIPTKHDYGKQRFPGPSESADRAAVSAAGSDRRSCRHYPPPVAS